MASTSTANSNLIQFPRLPSVAPLWDTTGEKLLPAHPLPSRAGRTLKQSRSTESLTQRKDRVEFLRRREWTRRVAASGDQPAVPTRRERTYSWEDIVAAADAAASTFDYDSSGYGFTSPGRPDTIDETDEDEPYVIYTATPRTPSASSLALSTSNSFSLASPSAYTTYTPNTPAATVIYSTSPSPPPSHSPTLSPTAMPSIGTGGPYYNRRASWRGPHSRHSSLSSISEEDEGLARF